MWEAWRHPRAFQEMHAPEKKQNRARHYALKQKTNAGPALRECGE
jgi:hypothetical protein